MGNLLDSIIGKLNSKYNGVLDCEEQRADLFCYVDGNEETIVSIDTEVIHFDGFDIKLIDADIHTLAYIDEVI
jgi:hypothetical protein